MTITATDIKLLESEVMADSTDGGGRKTSRIIVDGAAGNIFPKVSRLDSVYGRVNLRKVYGAVQTANVDTYAGAHAVVTDAPDNEKIHCTLFSTGSEFDSRTAARDRIESYVTRGPESRMVFFGRQLPGQQSFKAYQRTEEPLPEIGTVFCLSSENGTTVTAQQYVRVQDVSAETRNFTDDRGDFTYAVVTVEIGVPLRYEFNGPETPSRFSGVARPSKIRETTVVDAARYFGIQPLAEAAEQNALSLRVGSIYTAIVPTTQREAPLSLAKLTEASEYVQSAPAALVEHISAANWPAGTTLTAARGIKPGSLSIVDPFGAVLASDDAMGGISSAQFVATVDYETGAIQRTGGNASYALYDARYIPAARTTQAPHTTGIPITLANRGSVYSLAVDPLPAPGSVTVDYRALGKWYRLRDDGGGSVQGSDAAFGAGSVDYATGALVLTLGALPDVDSSVLVSWGSSVHYSPRIDDASATISQAILLPVVPLTAGSLTLSYRSGGADYTVTDTGNGTLTGIGAAGTVDYQTGDVVLQYQARLPDADSSINASYQSESSPTPGVSIAKTLATPASPVMQLDSTVAAKTLSARIPFKSTRMAKTMLVYVADDGNGNLKTPVGVPQSADGSSVDGGQTIGTVNYSTGEVVITADLSVKTDMWYNYNAGGWQRIVENASLVSGPDASLRWKSGGATVQTPQTCSVGFDVAPLRGDLVSSYSYAVVPGSVLFAVGGSRYIDRNGDLYADVSPSTGAGTLAGSINYATGQISLTHWTPAAAPAIAVLSCATVFGEFSANEFSFRTNGSPIRPSSLYVRAVTPAGDMLTGTADTNGNIAGDLVSGHINIDSGVVHVKFGEMVPAAGHENESWYDPAAVVNGSIFRPAAVLPTTFRYNAVVLSNLPLNADILGLDPVRLPTDGRVPIYRPADVVVIHNTQALPLENPLVPGKTYSAGRAALADAWLEDHDGKRLSDALYTADLDAGTVTVSAGFVATGLTQPIVLRHRIEDMALLTDVQINGQVAISAPLPRAYPQAGSFMSSALLFGDMNARATNVFDLQTFSEWADTPTAGANAQFNNIDYPIEVLNNGAVSERWRIGFTSQTSFQVVGENLGVIASGDTGTDCAPTNMLTGKPYFVLRKNGWGSGWSAGNQLRFNTVSAAAPIWIARTVLPGAAINGDSFSMQLRGDVDAE